MESVVAPLVLDLLGNLLPEEVSNARPSAPAAAWGAREFALNRYNLCGRSVDSQVTPFECVASNAGRYARANSTPNL